ncbi:hypothetical protein JSE7799_01336 [Jannaschia seosinensis]|uniref:Uncharacterized protein n=1 Tax=Jannaschia seosinensis TaxID=313367 RepID=A0A0M7B7D8_9RHOB|nr:hypothetical protein [Jannaschia seosinensis]CUH37864.1 hypothetical protein JSE7799_01336 [Jannaschia seosinensis]
MIAADQYPGKYTPEALTDYWWTPSVRATYELARELGLRRARGRYPLFAIREIEGLAPPSRRRWNKLKRPHLTTTDLDEHLRESQRSAHRRDVTQRDARILIPLTVRKKLKLCGRAWVNAWRTNRLGHR